MIYKDLRKKAEGVYEMTSITCAGCATSITIELPSSALFQMNQGALIDKVLPDQPLDVRERFISGICGDCWDKMFRVGEVE